MIKDIRYSGYSTAPSDYDCQDGELAASLDLINEDGAIRTILPPSEELRLSSGHRLLAIHRVSQQENYIFMASTTAGFSLAWRKRGISSAESMYSAPIPASVPLRGFLDIAIVGNTLSIATADGVFYILWSDGLYKFLGSKPPFIPISFGAYKAGTLNESNTTTYTDAPSEIVNSYIGAPNGSSSVHPSTDAKDKAEEFWKSTSNQAYGLLFKNTTKISQQGYVYQPFFIRYAYRLYDGSYSWHSAPVLMLVSVNRPIVYMRAIGFNSGELKITDQLDVPYFGIAYSILSDVGPLKDWSDIVTGIDIFISQPIYTYSQSEALGAPQTLKSLYDGVYTGGGWSSSLRGRRDYASVPSSAPSPASRLFTGHYATSYVDSDGVLRIGDFTDHFVDASAIENDKTLVCPLVKHPEFNDKIQHEYLFYKISSFDIEEIKGNTAMARLPLIKADLREINTLPRLEDDFNSHFLVRPSALHAYNSRLVLSGCEMAPPKPFPLAACAEAASDSSDKPTLSGAAETIKVYTRINGVKCVSDCHVAASPALVSAAALSPYPCDSSFPRFIYHPDPQAFRMEIDTAFGEHIALPLKQHPFLNGAYWFGGLGDEPTNFLGDGHDDTAVAVSAALPNRAYISEVNNPFLFPAQYAVSIDCGEIFRLASASKALSQGQFGQFPLYAFTDEGVWAMEVSSTGTISARQPFTRDVCINPAGITQIDSAVLFPTGRGVMLVSGSQAQCISDTINTDFPFQPSSIPSFAHICPAFPEILPFRDFIAGCGMLYDYAHQRIMIFNPNIPYAYVYSLKTHLWGMMGSSLSYAIDSYPEALAVDDSGSLLDFCKAKYDDVKSLLVTRPLKLDAPDVLKTIDTVIQRGHFRRGHVQCILYGSRDLFSWHLVWSSKDHYLRGFRGSPYKYFRIALLCDLEADESISGVSVQFTPRQTEQPL